MNVLNLNTLVILGKDGIKCLKFASNKGDYDTVKISGKSYRDADICCTYDYDGSQYVYRFYSSKKHSDCDRFVEAFGGVGISHKFGIMSRRENILTSDSNRYYIIEVDRVIGDLWKDIPLRDCGDFPSHLL